MIRELIEPERISLLARLNDYVDRRKPIYANPISKPSAVCGAIRGLDVSTCSLRRLLSAFNEDRLFIASQSLISRKDVVLIEVDACMEGDLLKSELNSRFPGIFAGDLVICWGESWRWQIVFDAQLALGVLVVQNSKDIATATDAYSKGDALHDISDAFAECIAYEVQDLPEGLKVAVSSQIWRDWGVAKCPE